MSDVFDILKRKDNAHAKNAFHNKDVSLQKAMIRIVQFKRSTDLVQETRRIYSKVAHIALLTPQVFFFFLAAFTRTYAHQMQEPETAKYVSFVNGAPRCGRSIRLSLTVYIYFFLLTPPHPTLFDPLLATLKEAVPFWEPPAGSIDCLPVALPGLWQQMSPVR